MLRRIYHVLWILSTLLLRIVVLTKIPCDQPYLTKNDLWCFPCCAGYFIVSDCVKSGEQARCQPCRRGEYMPDCDNSPKCANCGSCSSRQVIVKNCSATSDIECECIDGYYWHLYEGYCYRHSKCGIGEGLAEEGTPFENTKCVQCKTGVSYSDRESFDACSPCSLCNSTSTVITECSSTQNAMCSAPKQQLPRQNKKIDYRILASIVASVAATIIAVVVIACILVRKRRRTRDTTNIETKKVKLPNLNEEENGKVNCNSVSQKNSEVKKSFEIVDEKDTFNQNVEESESSSCSDDKSDTESAATNCNDSDNILVKSNVCHQNNEDNGLQNDRTANETNAKGDDADNNKERKSDAEEGDLKDTKNIEYAQNDKMKDVPKSDDASILVTPHANNNNSTLGTSIEPYNCATELESAPSGNLENSNVSLDVADVSPRGSFQLEQLSKNTEETILTDASTPQDQPTNALEEEIDIERNGESHEGRSVQVFQSDCKVWFEAITFLAHFLKWDEFNLFVRNLVANTNEKLLETIHVAVDHAKVEENNCKNVINNVMDKWRQATPNATVNDVVQALKESELNLVSDQLTKRLSQTGPGNKVPTPSASRQNNEMFRIQSRGIHHEIENLKTHEEFV